MKAWEAQIIWVSQTEKGYFVMQHFFKLSLLSVALLGSQFASANEFWSQDRQWLLGDWNGSVSNLKIRVINLLHPL